MKKRALVLVVGGLILALAAAPVFSQGLSGKLLGHQVTIVVNVPNASIFVDDRQFPGNVVNMSEGPHDLRVSAPGFADFLQTITVTDDMTMNVTLRPLGRMFPVTVISSVPGALILVDGAQAPANRFPVTQGSHTIVVSAPGYQDFTTTVNITGPITIQARLQSALIPLTIQPSAPNASIFIDGARISGNVANVAAGTHTVRVTAPGFQEFNTTVNVAGPMVVQAPLGAMGIPLTIQTNVPGAIVLVDNLQVPGNTANVRPGRHVIRVSAPGYLDFNTSVNVTGPLVVNARLTPAGIPLTVTSNVQGAMVTVNDESKGEVPYTESLPPGSYTVTVSAPGYTDFVTSVSLAKATTINAQLRAGVANVSLVIPPQFLNREASREGAGQLKLLVDGKSFNFRKDAPRFSVTAGRHRIVLSSGALTVQFADFDFEAGRSYTLELYMELQVNYADN